MTSGLLHEPMGHPRVRGFVQRIPGVFDAATASEGFLGFPAEQGDDTGRASTTLSVWRDLESVFAFSYAGVHAEALVKRQEWFVPSEFPGYAAWWIPDDQEPSWSEALDRFDRLCHAGPGMHAFDFKHALGSDGQPYQIDRDAVKALMRRNALRGVLTAYLAAWNEKDATARRALLERVWAPDGHYTDPVSQAVTLAELDAIIGAFHVANPGATFTQDDDFDHHHGHVRFHWSVQVRPGVKLRGMDYGQVNAANLLQTIVGFFGPHEKKGFHKS
ncbi:DUF3291 domain-containing protein (plasmid) [Deinococcus radiomollis]|uniref:DUF3291 domain-containing protein n=1 Tax=Deinococcus radiomollis TaxID=468916 RepID=UPI0038919D4F